MSETNTAVETKAEAAATQPEVVATQTAAEAEDYEAKLAQVNAELAKTREERENYKRGMLKAKGKMPEEDDNFSNEDEDLDAKIDRKVQERLLATKEAQALAEKEALLANLVKKNKELTLALKNRGQVSSASGQGSNQEQPEVRTDKTLSNEQLSALKARGWDDKKIEEFKKNLLRQNQTPR